MLYKEIKITLELTQRGLDGFSILKDYKLDYSRKKESYMVLHRFGLSLQDLMDKKTSYFSLKSVMQIGIQLTDLLRKFHSLGYVYNDLKPDNICVGNLNTHGDFTDQHKLFLIDFGLATKFWEAK